MLQDSRLNEILKLVDQKGAVRVDELAKLFNISESTIRRDLIELSKQNKLIKVHGGQLLQIMLEILLLIGLIKIISLEKIWKKKRKN